MLQRKDIAKEFSIIVQQEIKNHNDQILACHTALGEFSRVIEALGNNVTAKTTVIAQQLNNNRAEVQQIEKSLEDAYARLRSSFTDAHAVVNAEMDGLKKSIETRESYFLTLEGFAEFSKKIDQALAHFKVAAINHREVLDNELRCVASSAERMCDRLRLEISQKFVEMDNANKETNKMLDIYAVNFSGVMRELEIVKKQCFVIEKNIENIYLQIERIKQG